MSPAGSPPRRGDRVVVVRGGSVLDPGGTGFHLSDVVIQGATVAAVGVGLAVPAGATVLEAEGCLVGPGLVDLHAHLRQPGGEEAETVESAARAAALGGYTAVVAMPNTEPPVDDAGVAREILALGRDAMVEVAVAGAITVGRRGERLAPMAELARLGVQIFTDDGSGVQDGGVMRRAMEYARGLGVTLAEHCEDASLAAGGAMHEGAWSARLGIPGIPAAAEEAMAARDIALVRLTGCPLHLLHVSTAGTLALVRQAKAEGLPVTAEVTPHHLFLTDAEAASFDPVFKVNPPLRSEADREALAVAVGEGIVDAVATDHAPHPPEAKEASFDAAPPGMLGLETALAVVFSALHGHGHSDGGWSGPAPWPPGGGRVSPARIFAAMSAAPAGIARLRAIDVRPGGHSAQGGPIVPGAAANICVFDPSADWVVDPGGLASRSRNTPYAGRTLVGRVRHTVVAGEPVVVDAVAQR